MDDSTYLTALGVTQWRLRDTKVRPFQVICDDESELKLAQPLIDTVLMLMGVPLDECEFTTEPNKAKQIVWDLRRHKVRPRTAWLVSEPVIGLLTGSDGKRALWQQISQWLDKQQSPK